MSVNADNSDNAQEHSRQVADCQILWDNSHEERLQRLLRSFFVGNPNACAIQQPNGRYFPAKNGEKYIPLESADLKLHIEGQRTIGTYPVLPEKDECRILVLDFDLEDPNALNQLGLCLCWVKAWFKHFGIEALIEPSGSNGGHLWVLFKAWLPAVKAMRLGEAAVAAAEKEFGPQNYTIEIFPKQSEVAQDGLGNLIKLPWGVHQETGRRTTFVNEDGAPLPNDGADVIEALQPITEEKLDEILNKVSVPIEQAKVTEDIPPCIQAILKGVAHGCRDEAAFALACYFLHRGYSQAKTLERLREWDSNNSPPLTEKELKEKLKSAKKGYPFGCRSIIDNNLLAAFCVGEDKCLWILAQNDLAKAVADGEVTLERHESEPATYVLHWGERTLDLTPDDIYSYATLRRRAFGGWNILLAPLNQNAWEEALKRLIAQAAIISEPGSSVAGEVLDHLERFISHSNGVATKLRDLDHMAFPRNERFYFRERAFEDYLFKRADSRFYYQRHQLPRAKVSAILRAVGGEKGQVRVAKDNVANVGRKQVLLWRVPKDFNEQKVRPQFEFEIEDEDEDLTNGDNAEGATSGHEENTKDEIGF